MKREVETSLRLLSAPVLSRSGSGLKSEQGETGHPALVAPRARESLPLPVTGLILCGGRSKRMGRPKAFLPFARRTIIEHILNTIRNLFDEIFLVTNDPDSCSHLSVNVVKDILPYRGPLGGILSGLLVSKNPHAFVLACDMPLVSRQLLRSMSSERHQADVVVLAHKGVIEPLLGIYSQNLIKPLEESLFAGNLTVADFLVGLKAKTWELDTSALPAGELPPYFNVNTPQDYSRVLRTTKSQIF